MDKSIIEKYKAEMLNMYRSAKKSTVLPTATIVEPQITPPPNTENTGKLIVAVTSVRSLYPVKNAEVIVFTGDLDNMQVVARDFTDESGKTDTFILKTPAKSLSLSSSNEIRPYGVYNIEIKAEGFVDSVYLNVPVFSGVTSIKRVDMLLLETQGVNKGPLIYDEQQKYTLTDYTN